MQARIGSRYAEIYLPYAMGNLLMSNPKGLGPKKREALSGREAAAADAKRPLGWEGTQ